MLARIQALVVVAVALLGCRDPVPSPPADGSNREGRLDGAMATDGYLPSAGCEACLASTVRPCVCTLAGSGAQGGTDGPNAVASFDSPAHLAFLPPDTVLVTDNGPNDRVRAIRGGRTTTLAGGTGTVGADGPALGVRFNNPHGLVVEATGRILLADARWIRSIHQGWVQVWAGDGKPPLDEDGPLLAAGFLDPVDLALDGRGRVYVAEYSRSLRLIESGVVKTLVKRDLPSKILTGVAVDHQSRVYLSEHSHDRVLVYENGTQQVLAGSQSGFADGPNAKALFTAPMEVVLSTDGSLYVADGGNHRIRKIANGVTSSVAGDGTPGYRDGSGTSARFHSPSGLTIDTDGNLYVGEVGNRRIRVVVMK